MALNRTSYSHRMLPYHMYHMILKSDWLKYWHSVHAQLMVITTFTQNWMKNVNGCKGETTYRWTNIWIGLVKLLLRRNDKVKITEK